MTACEQQDGLLPELLVLVASVEDADVLAALGARDPEVLPVLVATGRDPMAVDEALDDLGALAGRVLIVDDAAAGPAAEAAVLLPRIDALVADDRPERRRRARRVAHRARRGPGGGMALGPRRGPAGRRRDGRGDRQPGGDRRARGDAARRGDEPADVRSVAAAQRLVRERLAATDAPRIVRLPTDRTLSA